jgi:hypothetical protein
MALLLRRGAGRFDAQERPPGLLQIYRDSVNAGSEASYRTIEKDAARICVELGCPHPHLAIESLTTPTEVWWLNAYESEAQKDQVYDAYTRNRALMAALEQISSRKQDLTAAPDDILAHYRADLSRGSAWKLTRTRFFVVTVTRSDRHTGDSVFEAPDGRRFSFTPVETRAEADALVPAGDAETRIFAVRPYWGMPAKSWIAADPEFWKANPAATK